MASFNTRCGLRLATHPSWYAWRSLVPLLPPPRPPVYVRAPLRPDGLENDREMEKEWEQEDGEAEKGQQEEKKEKGEEKVSSFEPELLQLVDNCDEIDFIFDKILNFVFGDHFLNSPEASKDHGIGLAADLGRKFRSWLCNKKKTSFLAQDSSFVNMVVCNTQLLTCPRGTLFAQNGGCIAAAIKDGFWNTFLGALDVKAKASSNDAAGIQSTATGIKDSVVFDAFASNFNVLFVMLTDFTIQLAKCVGTGFPPREHEPYDGSGREWDSCVPVLALVTEIR